MDNVRKTKRILFLTACQHAFVQAQTERSSDRQIAAATLNHDLEIVKRSATNFQILTMLCLSPVVKAPQGIAPNRALTNDQSRASSQPL